MCCNNLSQEERRDRRLQYQYERRLEARGIPTKTIKVKLENGKIVERKVPKYCF